MRIVLASASPRRHQLLKEVVEQFEILPADIDENINIADPADLVKQLARCKAESVLTRAGDAEDIKVIGADTIVVLDNVVLGKPKDKSDAINMLSDLSGNTHTVFTGVAVVTKKRSIVDYETTKVTIDKITPEVLHQYVKSGLTMDKAGGYGLQDLEGFGIKVTIDGNHDNVIGLPVKLLRRLLSQI